MSFLKQITGILVTEIRILLGRRRYPIKYDKGGRPARWRSFELFDAGLRPKDVYQEVGVSLRTACRYYQSWKAQGGKQLRLNFPLIARAVRKHLEISDPVVQLLAEFHGITPTEVILLAQEPWGILRLVKGEWPNRRRDRIYCKQDARLYSALKLVSLLEAAGRDPERIREITDRIADEIKKAAAERGQGT